MATPNGSEALPQRDTPSPTSRPSGSLQAAATVNAGLQHESSRASSSGSLPRNLQSPNHGRRRSSVLLNLQLNDPAVPAPGEMVTDTNGSGQNHFQRHQTSSPQPLPGSPRSPLMIGRDPLHHHGRAPSLGEIHQEFEAETEAHVNRLLQVIQQQQLQLQQLQSQQGQGQGQHSPSAPAVTGENIDAATSPPALGGAGVPPPASSSFAGSLPRSPVQPRGSFDLARADLQRRSRTPSRTASPRLRAASMSGDGDPLVLGGRDESAFYQAETQMLTRENQMLRHRIRDLERQLGELGVASPAATVTHEPFQHSNLTLSTSVSAEENPAGGARVAPSATASSAADTSHKGV